MTDPASELNQKWKTLLENKRMIIEKFSHSFDNIMDIMDDILRSNIYDQNRPNEVKRKLGLVVEKGS